MNFLSLFLTIVSLTLVRAQTCYFADGSISPSDVPCTDTSGGGASMCCASNEYCFSNGLCVSPETLTFNRGSCTDQTWSSSGCARYCMTELFAGLWACDSKNDFSCTPNDCTNTFQVPGGKIISNRQVELDLGLANASSTSTTATASTATVTQTQTITPTSNNSSSSCTDSTASLSSQKSSTLSIAAAAGIGVGVGLPLLILLGAAVFLLHREKKKARDALRGGSSSNNNHRPAGLAEMHAQHQGSYQSNTSDYRYHNPPPAFGAPHQNPNAYSGASMQQMLNKPLPVEMEQNGNEHQFVTELSGNSPTFKR